MFYIALVFLFILRLRFPRGTSIATIKIRNIRRLIWSHFNLLSFNIFNTICINYQVFSTVCINYQVFSTICMIRYFLQYVLIIRYFLPYVLFPQDINFLYNGSTGYLVSLLFTSFLPQGNFNKISKTLLYYNILYPIILYVLLN